VIHVKHDDRVLLLAVPASDEVRALAAQLSSGIVVCLAPEDRVSDLRREVSNVENVMVAPAADDGSIPWKEAFFSVVVAPDLVHPSAEVLRVAAPGATIHLCGGGILRG
jgi:hypothetical protein